MEKGKNLYLEAYIMDVVKENWYNFIDSSLFDNLPEIVLKIRNFFLILGKHIKVRATIN